jgi:hypothetical protein
VYEGRFRDDAIDGQGTMKMSHTMIVPNATSVEEVSEEKEEKSKDQKKKEDFMIPLSFQSDMGHIHRKAGFTHGGK